jgi:hypothetical protein
MREFIQDNKLAIAIIIVVGLAVAGFGATQTDVISTTVGETGDHSEDAMEAQGDAMTSDPDAMESEDLMENDSMDSEDSMEQ